MPNPVDPQDAVTLHYFNTESGVWQEYVATADLTNSSNATWANITDIQLTATVGSSYYIELTLIFKTAASGTGFGFSFGTTDTAAGTLATQVNLPINTDGTAALYTGSITSIGDTVTSTAVETANNPYICNVKGVFVCTASGTLVPRFRSEVNGSTATLMRGSVSLYREFV